MFPGRDPDVRKLSAIHVVSSDPKSNVNCMYYTYETNQESGAKFRESLHVRTFFWRILQKASQLERTVMCISFYYIEKYFSYFGIAKARIS